MVSSSHYSSSTPFPALLMVLALSFHALVIGSCSAQLSPNFYSRSCPKLFGTVRSVVESAVSKERRIGASLLRLFFHDCFVNGCDGSILLDDTSSMQGEKSAAPNLNSARGFNVIDAIKSKVEELCPGVVSCADILAITARDSVALLGGPSWKVNLGRRDSKTASRVAANNGIPPPSSSLSSLISRFQSHGLSAKDMVALSGAHTIGEARCSTFRAHIYNETSSVDSSFGKKRQEMCPSTSGKGDNNLSPLDYRTTTIFDNKYYNNVMNKRGLLHSDQQLYSGGSTDSIVQAYSSHPGFFRSDFATAMIKMGDITPLTGSDGEIRTNCRKSN